CHEGRLRGVEQGVERPEGPLQGVTTHTTSHNSPTNHTCPATDRCQNPRTSASRKQLYRRVFAGEPPKFYAESQQLRANGRAFPNDSYVGYKCSCYAHATWGGVMCGITGWVSYQRDLGSEQAVLDRMTETMSCRGPDARGTWLGRHAAIGHRRLAVIDL